MSRQKGFVPESWRQRGDCPAICISELLSWSSMRYGRAAIEDCHSGTHPQESGLLSDFTQQIWIMLKEAENWAGYANAPLLVSVCVRKGGQLLFGRSIIPSLKDTLLLTAMFAWQSQEERPVHLCMHRSYVLYNRREENNKYFIPWTRKCVGILKYFLILSWLISNHFSSLFIHLCNNMQVLVVYPVFD